MPVSVMPPDTRLEFSQTVSDYIEYVLLADVRIYGAGDGKALREVAPVSARRRLSSQPGIFLI